MTAPLRLHPIPFQDTGTGAEHPEVPIERDARRRPTATDLAAEPAEGGGRRRGRLPWANARGCQGGPTAGRLRWSARGGCGT